MRRLILDWLQDIAALGAVILFPLGIWGFYVVFGAIGAAP